MGIINIGYIYSGNLSVCSPKRSKIIEEVVEDNILSFYFESIVEVSAIDLSIQKESETDIAYEIDSAQDSFFNLR